MNPTEELKTALHPKLNILFREDGAFYVKDRHGNYRWTYGNVYKSSRGYIRYRNYFVHRAVAECFIPNPDGKPTVDHIDRNRNNNCVSNLRWATHSEQRINSSQSIGHNTKEAKRRYQKARMQKFVRYTNDDGKRVEILRDLVEFKTINGVRRYVLKNGRA